MLVRTVLYTRKNFVMILVSRSRILPHYCQPLKRGEVDFNFKLISTSRKSKQSEAEFFILKKRCIVFYNEITCYIRFLNYISLRFIALQLVHRLCYLWQCPIDHDGSLFLRFGFAAFSSAKFLGCKVFKLNTPFRTLTQNY